MCLNKNNSKKAVTLSLDNGAGPPKEKFMTHGCRLGVSCKQPLQLTYLACRYLCLVYCIANFCWGPRVACLGPTRCEAEVCPQLSRAKLHCDRSLLPWCSEPALSVGTRPVVCQLEHTDIPHSSVTSYTTSSGVDS
jgi:hypothetical protein